MPYASNEDIARAMRAIASEECASIARVVAIGTSARGVPIEALRIEQSDGGARQTERDSDDDVSAPGRLRFGFMANMHGDEPSGRAIAMEVARMVCAKAKAREAKASRLTREATLYVIPTVNPDGFAAKTRGNANGVDLNRNFPYTTFEPPKDAAVGVKELGGKDGENAKTEAETATIMKFSEEVRMVGVLNYHEGALVANYPWDGNERGGKTYSAAPDDATFKYLASTYASAHPTMSKSSEFKGGITNGAAWYPLWGGMQDWHYVNTGTMDLTIEVDDAKWPTDEKIGRIVDEHAKASIEFVSRALFGSVRGYVRDEKGVGIAGVTVNVGDEGLPVLTDAAGFFAKPAAPTPRKVAVRLTPPKGSRFQPRTHFVPAIDESNGATMDIALDPVRGRLRGATVRVSLALLLLLAYLAIRRALRRRRRVAAISESISTDPDVEKAIANRRGASAARVHALAGRPSARADVDAPS